MTARLTSHLRRILAAALTAVAAVTALAGGQGVPFTRHYSSNDYKAHNRNYDVVCDSYGSVFVANHDGVLYYDGSSWRKVRIPGVNHVTRVAYGPDGRIWAGGNNVLGYLDSDNRGRLSFHAIAPVNGGSAIGEIDFMFTDGDKLIVHTASGKAYTLHNSNSLVPIPRLTARQTAHAAAEKMTFTTAGTTVRATANSGVEIVWEGNHRLLTKRDGLGSNNVSAIAYNGGTMIWGATDRGLFSIELPSPFTRLTEAQGLPGEVYSLCMEGTTLYIGTMQGIFRQEGDSMKPVLNTPAACWKMTETASGTIIAATANGLYSISGGNVTQITDGNTFAVCHGPGNLLYTGETDGIYEVSANDGHRRLIAQIEKCVRVRMVGTMLRAETLYGEQWNVPLGRGGTLEHVNASLTAIRPKEELYDNAGRRWFTDSDGKNLQVTIGGKTDLKLTTWLRPMAGRTVNAMYMEDGHMLWMGGDFGVIGCDMHQVNRSADTISRPPLYIRQIVAFSDSVIWGGYRAGGASPKTAISDIRLPSSCRSLAVHFSTASNSLFMPAKYRYRINDDRWSAWSEEPVVYFNNMSYGPTKMEIQSQDIFGAVSSTATVEWYRQFPLYLKWWAVMLYVLLFFLLIRQIAVYRVSRLERMKRALERVVSKRTEELFTARSDLKRTQADLMRMERTATAGKLTKGLIDRILNPINYINNFSMLTSRLADELRENIRSEREHIAPETYEDCEEIIGMMQTNLAKIEDHGANTTRTLRAMEAMLNNQIGELRSVDMSDLCHQAVEMTAKQYRDSITACHINLHSRLPAKGTVMCMVDPTALRRALRAVLSNAIYAVEKKYQRQPYDAEVMLSLAAAAKGGAQIVIHDNGIGIEEAITARIFDPFFTTKPTGEASGVGLYLARETIHDHNGTITMQSVKDEHTDFTITL